MSNLYNKALELFDDIDRSLENHYKNKKKQPPCAKGCASCCSQFFEISELEFSLIYESIMTLDEEKKKELSDRAYALYHNFKDHWPIFYSDYFLNENINRNDDMYYESKERFEVTLPCVFLANDGSCDIYSRRPFTCRTTGVGYTHLINRGAVCQYIRFGITTPLWQADLRKYNDDIEDIRWITSEVDKVGYKRQYPMFYYVYDLFHNKKSDYYSKLLNSYKYSK